MDDARPEPLVRRISPVTTAALFLIVCAAAGWNIYGSPSVPGRVITLAIGGAAFCYGFAAMRMYLIADDEGVAVRFLRSEQWLPWPEVSRIEVVGRVRGANTVRLSRADGSHVDVPPSLLQPARPTNLITARKQLEGVARQLETLRDGG